MNIQKFTTTTTATLALLTLPNAFAGDRRSELASDPISLGKSPRLSNTSATPGSPSTCKSCGCSTCSCAPCIHALAPIGVMGDHLHGAGGLMMSYRYMNMAMGGHRSGTASLSSAEVHAEGFEAAATEMDMEMHMLGVMWAPTDNVTLMVMGNYLSNDMQLVSAPGSAGHGSHGASAKSGTHMTMESAHMESTHMAAEMMHAETTHSAESSHSATSTHGSSFGHDSEGWGDTSITALIRIPTNDAPFNAHAHIGLSLPTGSVDERQHGSLLPYGMQLGSGTYDLKLGATLTGHAAGFSCGAQALGTLRLEDENDLGYALGERIDATAWIARPIAADLSASARLAYTWQDEISGHYNLDHPHASPPYLTENYGGHILEGAIGLSTSLRGGHRLAAEFIAPIHQDLNGIGMERDHAFVIGWQWGF